MNVILLATVAACILKIIYFQLSVVDIVCDLIVQYHGTAAAASGQTAGSDPLHVDPPYDGSPFFS